MHEKVFLGEVGKNGKRGSRWCDGDRITGTSTESKAYQTGLLDALPDDYYLNSETGNIYRCTSGGDENTALWVFVGNIKGAMPDVENSFNSTNRKNALSANAGRILYEKIVAAGIFSKELKIACDTPVCAIKVTVENKSTSIALKDAKGNTGLHNYSKTGSEESVEVLIWIGEAIGLASGSVLTQVSSTNTGILKYELYNEENQVVASYQSDIWEILTELIDDHTKEMTITEKDEDESAQYDAYRFSNLKDGIRETAFPVSHVKAIWWNRLQNKTLYDRIMEGLFGSEQIISDAEELQALDETSVGTFVPDAYLMGQLMNYVYAMPVIRSGTEEPDDSVGKDGDIYIMMESEE